MEQLKNLILTKKEMMILFIVFLLDAVVFYIIRTQDLKLWGIKDFPLGWINRQNNLKYIGLIALCWFLTTFFYLIFKKVFTHEAFINMPLKVSASFFMAHYHGLVIVSVISIARKNDFLGTIPILMFLLLVPDFAIFDYIVFKPMADKWFKDRNKSTEAFSDIINEIEKKNDKD